MKGELIVGKNHLRIVPKVVLSSQRSWYDYIGTEVFKSTVLRNLGKGLAELRIKS